jgi:hypothetical protein
VRCKWVPVATSLRARRLWLPLPKAWSGQCLSVCRKPLGMLDRGPESLPRVDERCGRGRRVAKSHLPMLIIGWRSDGRGSFPGLVFFVGGPSSSTWSGGAVS